MVEHPRRHVEVRDSTLAQGADRYHVLCRPPHELGRVATECEHLT